MLSEKFLYDLGFEMSTYDGFNFEKQLNLHVVLEYLLTESMCALRRDNGVAYYRIVIPKIIRTEEDLKKIVDAVV